MVINEYATRMNEKFEYIYIKFITNYNELGMIFSSPEKFENLIQNDIVSRGPKS